MISLPPVLIIAIIICAVLTIAGEYAQPRQPRLIYIFKPLTTILILTVALLPGTFATSAYARAIVIGLLFSLMGDIWLMLPRDFFLYGLASFLAAHVCYIIAFWGGIASQGFAWVALALALVGAVILAYLWRGVSAHMRPAVVIYVAAILTMAALAVARAIPIAIMVAWGLQGARIPRMSFAPLWAGAGALLFVVSDATLAINRFRRPFRLAQGLVLGTYFAAQLLIALSVSLR
jgi:uncharacterized membrane protein YhhN